MLPHVAHKYRSLIHIRRNSLKWEKTCSRPITIPNNTERTPGANKTQATPQDLKAL